MYWMLTPTIAATPPAIEHHELDPIERIWAGGGSCDATRMLHDAAEQISGAPWDHMDDPGPIVHENMHVLQTWDQARGCATIRRSKGVHLFHLYNFGGVLIAAARNALDRDPAHAAELAVEAFTFGNDAAVGGFVSSMIGAAIHRSALDVVAEAWPSLTADERARTARRLRTVRSKQPRLDTNGERATMQENAEAWQAESWVPVSWCLSAHEEALKRIDFALEQADPRSHLDANEALSWTEWAGSACSAGLRNVALGWFDEQDHIEAQLIRLERSGADRQSNSATPALSNNTTKGLP